MYSLERIYQIYLVCFVLESISSLSGNGEIMSDQEIMSDVTDMTEDLEESLGPVLPDSLCSVFSCCSDPSEADSCALSDLMQDLSDPAFTTQLYSNAPISIFESHILCFQYAIRHTLTNSAFNELLQLIGAHLPDAKAPTSVYRLKKFFLELLPQAKCSTHDYCADCHQLLEYGENATCEVPGCPRTSINQFITIPLKQQIKHVFEGM